MSTLKVDGIRSNSATSDAITLASDGTCTANITNNLSNRNLIINGAMQVAQRGTSFTAHPSYAVDRFRWGWGNLSTGGNITVSQQSLSSSDTPYTLGFRKYTRAALPAAGTANANAYINLTYKAEGQDIANSGWNYTSASSYITISFWFRCSTNQTFYAEFQSKDGTAQSYAFSFTASGNNTWTKITKTVPGNSNVQIDNDNGGGFDIRWYPFYGTDYTNNKTLDSWSAYSGSNILPDMASTWLTAGASTFDVTGVQLEVGSVATDFEHRSYADELQRCYRYCQRFDPSGNSFRFICQGSVDNDGNTLATVFNFLTPFRAAPSSLTTTGDASDYAIRRDTTKTCTSVPSMYSPSAFTAGVSFVSNNHGWSTGQSGNAQFRSNNAYLIFSAEL